MEKDELPALREQTGTLEAQLSEMVIATDEDLQGLSDRVKKVKDFRKEVEAAKKRYTDPANEILRQARSMYDPLLKQLEAVEAGLKRKGVIYVEAKDAKAEKEKGQIIGRVERGTMRPETAAAKLEEVPEVTRSVKSASSGFQVKKVQVVEIVDETLIPRAYLVPDMVKIKAAAITAKLEIPGVRVVTKSQAASV